MVLLRIHALFHHLPWYVLSSRGQKRFSLGLSFLFHRQKALYESQLQDDLEEQRQKALRAREAELEAFDRQNNGALPTASERRLEEQANAAFHGASSKKVRSSSNCGILGRKSQKTVRQSKKEGHGRKAKKERTNNQV